MKRKSISKIRASAGRLGAAARWGERPKTKTVRVFVGDAEKLDAIATQRQKRVADVVHELASRPF